MEGERRVIHIGRKKRERDGDGGREEGDTHREKEERD